MKVNVTKNNLIPCLRNSEFIKCNINLDDSNVDDDQILFSINPDNIVFNDNISSRKDFDRLLRALNYFDSYDIPLSVYRYMDGIKDYDHDDSDTPINNHLKRYRLCISILDKFILGVEDDRQSLISYIELNTNLKKLIKKHSFHYSVKVLNYLIDNRLIDVNNNLLRDLIKSRNFECLRVLDSDCFYSDLFLECNSDAHFDFFKFLLGKKLEIPEVFYPAIVRSLKFLEFILQDRDDLIDKLWDCAIECDHERGLLAIHLRSLHKLKPLLREQFKNKPNSFVFLQRYGYISLSGYSYKEKMDLLTSYIPHREVFFHLINIGCYPGTDFYLDNPSLVLFLLKHPIIYSNFEILSPLYIHYSNNIAVLRALKKKKIPIHPDAGKNCYDPLCINFFARAGDRTHFEKGRKVLNVNAPEFVPRFNCYSS